MVTWAQRGAVGCSRCRFTGCRTCFNKKEPTSANHAKQARNSTTTKATATAKKAAPRKRQRKDTYAFSRTKKIAKEIESPRQRSLDSADSSDEESETNAGFGNQHGVSVLNVLEDSSSDESNNKIVASKGISRVLNGQESCTSSSESENEKLSSCRTTRRKRLQMKAADHKRTADEPEELHVSSSDDSTDDSTDDSSGDSSDANAVVECTVAGSSDDESSEDETHLIESSRHPEQSCSFGTSHDEATASVEIDRLLHEANVKYSADWPLDPHDTLALAKARWGCVELLGFLESFMCKYCGTQLGIYFEREQKQSKSFVGASMCGNCITRHRQDTWTLEQACEAFRRDDIITVLQNEYTPIQTEGSLSLYDSFSVTGAAIQVYGSLWEMQYALSKMLRRRPRQAQL